MTGPDRIQIVHVGRPLTDLLASSYLSPHARLRYLLVRRCARVGAANKRHEFRPGTRTSLDLGYRREIGDKLGLMLQLNGLYRKRDRGNEAEPANSGGRFLFLSPGFSYLLLENLQVYGFLQLPLYQYVNGVQLTADWAVVAGISARF
jgi:hypothetical protein